MALSGFFPAGGGILLVLINLAEIPFDTDLGFVGFSIYVLASSWISRGWYFQAFIGAALVEGAQFIHSGSSAYLMAFMFGMTISIGVGLAVRWQKKRIELMKDQMLHLREQAIIDVTAQLKSELHDTIARNLVRISLAAQDLPAQANIRTTSERIESLARESLEATRTLMTGLADSRPTTGIADVIATCHTMLEEKSIVLTSILPEDFSTLTQDRLDLVALCIREGTFNVLKYAPPHSAASLVIDADSDSSMILTLVNPIATEISQDRQLSGGFGLQNLAAKTRSLGGVLATWNDHGRWIFTLELPTVSTRSEGVAYDPAN